MSSLLVYLKINTIFIESAGRMDVVVNDFSHDSITVAIKDKKSDESTSQEYAIRYNTVDVGFFLLLTTNFVTFYV